MEKLFQPGARKANIREIELPAPMERCYRRIAAASPYSSFLNSGTDAVFARWSFIGCDPYLVFTSKNGRQTIETSGEPMYLEGDPFETLDRIMGAVRVENEGVEIPFYAGGIGAFGYALGHHVERLPRGAADDLHLPDMVFIVYRVVIAHDRKENRAWMSIVDYAADADSESAAIEEIAQKTLGWMNRPAVHPAPAGVFHREPESNFSKEQYVAAVNRSLEYIFEGDIYQVNLSQRFNAPMKVSAMDLYSKLCEINPAPFSAFMDCGSFQLASSSPERFVLKQGSRVETRPIKGTRPRGATPSEDAALCRELLESEKDNAELAMIVDLERNDLGRVCQFGTVKVAEDRVLEKYATVSHLVATVEGRMKEGTSTGDLLRATFPGGSITGCPKIRSMEIIDEMEPHTRGFYTGSIGYIGFNGNMDLNIAIRTITAVDGTAYFHVGGGIVADSNADAEYEETLAKGRALVKALESAVPVADENLIGMAGRAPVSERVNG